MCGLLLAGDISQATVKELDANLFQGGELKEVYTEIMKTVPNIHQQYDNDPLVSRYPRPPVGWHNRYRAPLLTARLVV